MATNDPGGGQNDAQTTLKSDSYANRLKTDVKFDNRLKRNLLEITLEKTSSEVESEVIISQEAIARLFRSLKLDITTQVEGYQVIFNKGVHIISVWVANGVNLDKFCVSENISVGKGIITGSIRPAGRQNVTVTITGLDFNTPDTLVHDYIQKFGGQVLNKKVIYSKFSDGPFSGKYTGERKYQVNFTDAKRHMGTYHFLDGARVRVYYKGNIKTCGRCHSSAYHCPGGALAKICEEKGGARITLIDHMKKLWSEINFSPNSFELPESVDHEQDLPISNMTSFEIAQNDIQTSSQNGSQLCQAQPNLDRCIGLKINNFPLEMDNDEILKFINEKIQGNISQSDIEIIRSKKNSNVTIPKGLDKKSISYAM